jgi:hypothetical protein
MGYGVLCIGYPIPYTPLYYFTIEELKSKDVLKNSRDKPLELLIITPRP